MNIQKPTTPGGAANSSATPSRPVPRNPTRAVNLTLWILQGLLAATFLATGAMKLTSQPMPVELFEKLGAGQWLRYVTGMIEILGALLILFPRWASLSGGLLAGTMLGAMASHLTKVGGSLLPALVLFFLCILVAWGRRDRFFLRLHRVKT